MSTLPKAPITADADWWRQAIVYQVYPRSFADANGDGLGDLKGITSRVPYLARLGVDAIWLSPFYPSALADGGYDVDDYRDVDPRIGTLDDFDELVAALHGAGIRIIVDIVPNHTSDRHEWFREAQRSPKGSAARDRYIFRDGRGETGELPPADWTSIFGGPAWTRVEDGQWYLHNFASEQPDLNWRNPEVHADFLTTLRFWSDRGVDGFRVDVAHGLAKDLPDVLPTQQELTDLPKDGFHPMWDRDDVHEIYAEWRAVLDTYDPPRIAIAEAWVETPERRVKYAAPTGLGQAFNFDLLEADFDAAQFRPLIEDNLAEVAATGSSTTWVLSNHDVIRHATRYGLPPHPGNPNRDLTERVGESWLRSGGDLADIQTDRGLRRAPAATMLLFALPGSTYLYQGEELGLHEVGQIADEDRQDPAFFRDRGVQIGRDGCRVPIPWTADGVSLGFGDATPHLPQPAWYAERAVEVLERDASSTLALYRRAIELRRELQTEERLQWLPAEPGVLHFRRPNGWESITNFTAQPVPLPEGEVLLASAELSGGTLPGETTVWLRAGR